MKKGYLRNVVNEAYLKPSREQSTASIGAALNYLASNLKSGKLYPSELYADVQDILNSLNNAVRVAEKYADSDPWEALQDLLNKLRLD